MLQLLASKSNSKPLHSVERVRNVEGKVMDIVLEEAGEIAEMLEENDELDWKIGARWFAIDEDKLDDGTRLCPQHILQQRFEKIKSLSEKHEFLAAYLDFLQNGSFQYIIVSQVYQQRIARHELLQHTFMIPLLHALQILHMNGIFHGNLSLDSCRKSRNGDFRLVDYAMNFIASSIDNFPIARLEIMPPELRLDEKADIWMLGCMVANCIFHDLPSFHDNPQTFTETIQQTCSQRYSVIWNIFKPCLSIDPAHRPSVDELLKSFDVKPQFRQYCLSDRLFDPPLSYLTESSCPVTLGASEVYEIWTLSGFSVQTELSLKGVLAPFPSVLRLPLAFGSNSVTHERFIQRINLYYESCQKHKSYQKDAVVLDFSPDFLDLINCQVISDDPAPSDQSIREALHRMDLIGFEHEKHTKGKLLHRQIILSKYLLRFYPCTRQWVIEIARRGIPTSLRKVLWPTVLGIRRLDVSRAASILDDIQCTRFYDGFEEQLQRDIPRCHQYHGFLISEKGQRALEIMLKGWVALNPQDGQYWQGLDSICAPFVILYRDNLPLGLCVFNKFVSKFRDRFFVLGDLSAMQEMWIRNFVQLLCFHDPELALHLNRIGFHPQLYAVPWFLTMFAHLLPVERLIPLWDTLMVGASVLPLFIALAVLQSVRMRLLKMDLNGCILHKTNIASEISVSHCVENAFGLFEATPRCFMNPSCKTFAEISSRDIVDHLGRLELPVLSVEEFVQLRKTHSMNVIDTRSKEEFENRHLIGSVHLPESSIESFCIPNDKLSVILAQDTSIPLQLLWKGLGKLSILPTPFRKLEERLEAIHFQPS